MLLLRTFRLLACPLAFAAWLICGEAFAATASFNCARAEAPVEKAICGYDTLATADAQMAQAFSANLAAHPDDRQQAVDAQREWLKSRLVTCPLLPDRADGIDRTGAAALCLLNLYKRRIEELRDPDKSGISRTAEDRAICNGLAERMRTFTSSGKSTPNILIGEMAAAGDSFVSVGFDRSDLAKSIRPRLPADFASDLVWDESGEARDSSGFSYTWNALGNSSIVAANVIEGTGYCQNFTFFDVAGDGPIKSVPPPEPGEGGYCTAGSSGGRGMPGEIGGRPTFVGVDFGDGVEDYRLIVRSHDRWVRTCRIHASWPPAFALSKSNCDGRFCEPIRKQAVDIVHAYDTTGDLPDFWSNVAILPTPDAHKQRLEAFKVQVVAPRPGHYGYDGDDWVAEAQGQYRTIDLGGTATTIARFDHGPFQRYLAVSGTSPDNLTVTDITPNDRDSSDAALLALRIPGDASAYDSFGDDSTIVPVKADGKTYLLRIGHAHFTYRTIDDYMLGIFGSDNGKIEPLGGFYIAKSHGPKATVTVLDPSTP